MAKTWKECEKHTKGVSASVCRAFANEALARAFADGVAAVAAVGDGERVYTDGSWISAGASMGRIGWGVVDGDVKLRGELSLAAFQCKFAVAGKGSSSLAELCAVLCAMEQLKPRPVTICADNMGVKMWLTGEWKAKEPPIRALVDAIRRVQRERGWPSLTYVHIPGHSGIAGNEAADRLACGVGGVEVKLE